MNAVRIFGAGLVLIAQLCAGCRTSTPMPVVDLSAPGWRELQGQAVWKPSQDRPGLAGDLLLATNENGNCFIEFSKIPFPLATAEALNDRWQIEFGADEHAWHGRGAPPDRFVWFQLPRALLGGSPGGNWKFGGATNHSWRLENPRTGETLEGEFFP